MKKWILIDSSMNVLLINSSEFIDDFETKEYISKNLDKVIRCKNIIELNKTIKNYLKELKEYEQCVNKNLEIY